MLILTLFQFTEGKFGVPDKADVGMLVWTSDWHTHSLLKIGSRLKSPNLPIWVTCANDNWGVLFSPNIETMRSSNMESR